MRFALFLVFVIIVGLAFYNKDEVKDGLVNYGEIAETTISGFIQDNKQKVIDRVNEEVDKQVDKVSQKIEEEKNEIIQRIADDMKERTKVIE